MGILHHVIPAMVQLPRPAHKTIQTLSTVGVECMLEDSIKVAVPLLPVKWEWGFLDQSPPQRAGVYLSLSDGLTLQHLKPYLVGQHFLIQWLKSSCREPRHALASQ